MRDLFGSTSFIKFRVLETILSSSDAINKLLEFEKNKNEFQGDYTFLDYLSNIDSYLYGLVIFPSVDDKNIKKWLNNYIHYLYIPLIKRDSIYILKSRLIIEIFKIKDEKSRINENIKSYIKNDIFNYLEEVVLNNEESLIEKLDNLQNEEEFVEYLLNYYSIYKNRKYIEKVYINNYKLREKLSSLYEFLK